MTDAASGTPLTGTRARYGPGLPAVGVAAGLLGLLGVEVDPDDGIDGLVWGHGPEVDAGRAAGSEVADWARSGAMALTGLPDGPPLVAPGTPASVAQGAALAIEALTSGDAECRPVTVDGARLLGEHAAFADLERRGAVSPGGSCRLLVVRDGVVAVNLARPEDVDLVGAWLCSEVGADVWETVARVAANRTATELVERAQLIGIPVSLVPQHGEVPEDEQRRHHDRQIPLGPWRIAVTSSAPPRRRGLVVDLSSMWAGPLCAQLLGLAGFDVVKVESRSRPDGSRGGPAGFYDLLHFGHRSVALDFADARDLARLSMLLERADVVVEASRPRALDGLGVGPAVVLERSPATVWVAITGYGRDGPWCNRVAFGDDAAAAAGLVAHADDGTEVFCGDAIADPLTGLHAALAALAMLVGGRGGLVDVALRDVASSTLGAGQAGSQRSPAARRVGDDWYVDTPDGAVQVRGPGARPVPGSAAPTGSHTDEVLDELGIP